MRRIFQCLEKRFKRIGFKAGVLGGEACAQRLNAFRRPEGGPAGQILRAVCAGFPDAGQRTELFRIALFPDCRKQLVVFVQRGFQVGCVENHQSQRFRTVAPDRPKAFLRLPHIGLRPVQCTQIAFKRQTGKRNQQDSQHKEPKQEKGVR